MTRGYFHGGAIAGRYPGRPTNLADRQGAPLMVNASNSVTHPAPRIAAVPLGTLAVLLAAIAVVRPGMMTMHAMRQLIVGFGL
jgi:hypothetical protein